MIVPIVFCADGNYGRYLPVAVQSIIENSSAEQAYHIIIFDCGINAEDLAVLERQIAKYSNFSLRVENITAWLEAHQHIAAKSSWNRAIYGRLLVPEICADYDKAVYADADMIFNRDMAELINIDLGGNYIAAALDLLGALRRNSQEKYKNYFRIVLGMTDDQAYINSGLILYNIAAWRKHGLADKALQFLADNKTRLPDQDAINSVCSGKIYILPQAWNYNSGFGKKWHRISEKIKNQPFMKAVQLEWQESFFKNNIIIHYIDTKPWISFFTPKADIWWRYAAKTEFHGRLLSEALVFHNQADLARMDQPLIYRLFGIPLISVRMWPGRKKYYLGKMRARHIAELRFDRRSGYLAFYLFEVKIFGRQ